MFLISILIPAYNEEKNIGRLLESLSNQKIFYPFQLKKIVVITSGCTDKTEEIVKKFSIRNKKIKLISLPERKGKAFAINYFLKRTRIAKNEIIVMISADNLPSDRYTINNLLQPFLDEKVGLTCGRPIPTNPSTSLTNRISSLIWHLHHKVSLSSPPKVGELIAFRNLIKEIPEDTLADEERISAIIQRKGYKVVYVKDAVVYNKAPEKISELIEQRRRIFVGHLLIKKELGYIPPTLDLRRLTQVIMQEIKKNPLKILTISMLSLVEIFSRILGYLDFITGRYTSTWKICKTTKELF